MNKKIGNSRHDLKICLVVPCYNEEAVLGVTIPRLLGVLDTVVAGYACSPESFMLLVDDGSSDSTWDLIEQAAETHRGRVVGIRLACNVGHQGALLCGLEYATSRCDAAISIDADLQDDLNAIPAMIESHRAGAEMVLGVRESRDVDTWFKRNTALGFYKLMKVMGVSLVENHADFRLMSVRVLRNLQSFPEYNLFLRGLTPLLHKSVSVVTYRREERFAGDTKYPLKKMLALAWNGITSFSVVPLRLISVIGGLVFLTSLAMICYAVFGILAHNVVPGWASVVIPLYLLGGLVMLSIGIVGEYVGKLFLEVKRRPRFLVDTVAGGNADEERK